MAASTMPILVPLSFAKDAKVAIVAAAERSAAATSAPASSSPASPRPAATSASAPTGRGDSARLTAVGCCCCPSTRADHSSTSRCGCGASCLQPWELGSATGSSPSALVLAAANDWGGAARGAVPTASVGCKTYLKR